MTATKTEPPMRPGWKTSEFWLSLAAQAVSAAMASGVLTSSPAVQAVGLAGAILTAMGYTASRASVKKSANLQAATKAGPLKVEK